MAARVREQQPECGPGGGPSGGAGGTAGNGSSGSAGTAGSSAGSAGTGTVDEGDAGPDGSVESDASTDPPDSGPSTPADSGVNGDCTGFTTGLTTLAPQNNQDVVIARVIFNDDDETARVVLRVINDFSFGGEQVLCWGSTNSECASVDDLVTGDRPPGTELTVIVGTDDDPVDNDEGELLFAADTPENNPTVFAYVNWNDHDSEDVDAAGPLPSLEGFADAANFWTDGQTITLTGDENAFFGSGDTDLAAGFGVCTADQLID